MHSIWLRANAIVTFTITVLSVVCAVASLTDFFHTSTPKIDVKVLNIDSFQKQNGNDEVRLTMEITADLESVFTWNTKQLFIFLAAEYSTPKNALNQVSLWDAIITSKDMAKFSIRTRNKYNFVDQGSHLGGKDVNLTMYWNFMPFTGAMFSDQRTVSSVQIPNSYFKSM